MRGVTRGGAGFISDLLDLVFSGFERELTGFVHGGEVQEGRVAVEGVDEVGETLEGNAIVVAVELFEGGVNSKDVGEGVGTLETEFLVWVGQ